MFKSSNKAEIKAMWEDMAFLLNIKTNVFWSTNMCVQNTIWWNCYRDKNEYYRKFHKIEKYRKQDAAKQDKQIEEDTKIVKKQMPKKMHWTLEEKTLNFDSGRTARDLLLNVKLAYT